MSQPKFSLAWDEYKSSICDGFSSLQQNGEFVDMTLAADGHFVKVHQVLMAMVSPYLKELISSAPCQHPVIFLNTVSHRHLTMLLEYIYTGEALIPEDQLIPFINMAKSLHIKGLERLVGTVCTTNIPTFNASETQKYSTLEDSEDTINRLKRTSRQEEKDSSVYQMKRTRRSVGIPLKLKSESKKTEEEARELFDDIDTTGNDSDDFAIEPAVVEPSNTGNGDQTLQYSVSIRGSLQVILNRYIYNLTSTQRNGTRRWRCVEYRNRRCLAALATNGNLVMNRSHMHNHSFHDNKILQKIEKKAVFSAIDDVEQYKAHQIIAERSMEDESADELKNDNAAV